MDGVDQCFLDRVVTVTRRRRADRQGLVDPAGGFQGAQGLLETAGLQGVEHAEFGGAQGFFFDGTGVFEQRVVGKVFPNRAAGAVADQNPAEVDGSAQGAPVFKVGVNILEILHCGGSTRNRLGGDFITSRH